MKASPKEHITLSVPGKKNNVPIYIGADLFPEIKSIISFNKYSSVLAVIDENVSKHWADKIQAVLGENALHMTIPASEKNKTLATVEKIWAVLSKKNFDRKSLVINIGGGMVCDIGAFAASTYMRGISFMQIPTTLLAQADAAIGGKTGFNFNGLKNTIGTFSTPVAVISDTSFLSTLPQQEFRSGFAEIIKHAVISDNNLFEYLLNTNFTGNDVRAQNFVPLLKQSTNIKCEIVHNDPFEKNERKKLNFGHTVGHAVEMACNDLLHGEAIALGMIAEARMSFLSGYLPENKFRDIENLIDKAKLPNKVSASHKNDIFKKMLSDKKNTGGKIKWVFLEDIGDIKVDVTLPDEIVEESLNYILK
jgi:3-dehydroquinate synthase